MAMPTLACTMNSRPATVNGVRIAEQTRAATEATSSTPEASSRRMANSSPPMRATVSPGRTHELRRSAAAIKHFVAARVAERVVHVLEAVEIAQQHGNPAGWRGAPREGVLDAVTEEHPVRQLGQRVVKGEMDELDLVGSQSRDRVLHLSGEPEVFDQGEHLAGENGGDDTEPGDQDEPVEPAGLGPLQSGRDDRDGEKEVGERDLPGRRTLDLVTGGARRLGRPEGGERDRAGSRPIDPASTRLPYRNDRHGG